MNHLYKGWFRDPEILSAKEKRPITSLGRKHGGLGASPQLNKTGPEAAIGNTHRIANNSEPASKIIVSIYASHAKKHSYSAPPGKGQRQRSNHTLSKRQACDVGSVWHTICGK